MRYVAVLILISSIAMAIGVNVWADLDMFTFDATPSSDVSMYGIQMDLVFESPGNVRMGFGVEYHFVSADASFLGMNFDQSVGIYAVGVYRSELTSSLDLLVISRGGISLPNFDLSTMGYFTEVSVSMVYPLGEKWFVSFGGSLKSYSFGEPYVSFIPVKLGIGGDL